MLRTLLIHGKIIAKRGICQGDPLAPYLFTFAGNALSSLIHYCNEKRVIKGFSFGNMSSDLYVDDTLLLSSWDDGNLEVWWNVVNLFLLGSGLSLNVAKTINLNRAETDSFATKFGCKVDSLPFTYLGFSTGGACNVKEV